MAAAALTNSEIGAANIAADSETWSYSGNLPQGNYQLYAKLTHLVGNVGQTASEPTVIVDQTAPTTLAQSE
jgi:hypothetical protein